MRDSKIDIYLVYIRQVSMVVSAYVSYNRIEPAGLPALIASVHGALGSLMQGDAGIKAIEMPTQLEVRRSIAPDGLISFIDNKSYKSLKQHLSAHGFEPDSYRERYGLPRDYPMVAQSYSERRSYLARTMGLGLHKRRTSDAVSPSRPPDKNIVR